MVTRFTLGESIRTTLGGKGWGWFTAWFGFPLFEEAMADTRRLLSPKFVGTIEK